MDFDFAIFVSVQWVQSERHGKNHVHERQNPIVSGG